MKAIIFLAFILFVFGNTSAQTLKPPVPAPERIRTYDVQHIKIDVSFDWQQKKVEGNVETTIVPLAGNFREFEVDAVAFRINNIRDNSGNDLDYDYDGKKIRIRLDKVHSADDTIRYTVDYSCNPQRGIYFIYPTELNPSLPYQIWSQGEEADNCHWIPVYDYPNDKTTFEIYATIDIKYKTLSNGYLDYSRKIHDTELKQDHWVMDKPNSTYLIMFAAGEFNVVEENYDGIPIYAYTDKNINVEDSRYSFRNTAEMMKVFSEKYLYRYPWNKYAQVVVEDFIFGGMENTTATVLNKRSIYTPEIEGDYSSDDLISHELGHQWWGDVVTCRNWNEFWLNEAFATYSKSLWKEAHYGNDEYDYQVMKDADGAIRVDTTYGRYPVWAGYGTITTNVYDKGSAAIHSFRHVLGEDFFPALSNFLTEHSYGNVETKDLLEAFNRTYNANHNTNEDFKWMFDQWIWKAGYPEFDVSYKYDSNSDQLILNVRQVQKPDSLTPVFRMPVDVRVKSVNEDRIERIEVMDSDETFSINLSSDPLMVVFDYGNNYIDKSNFDKPFDDWRMQLIHCEDAIDRIMALRGLEKYLKGDESHTAGKPPITINQIEALKLFEQAVNGDRFRGVRMEAVRILGNNFILDRTGSILRDSYEMQVDSRVKREILRALGKSGRSDDAGFIKSKIQNEKNDYIVADGIYALGNCLEPPEVYDAIIQFGKRISHRNVVQNAFVAALDSADNKIDDPRIKEALKGIAFGIDVDGRLRVTAISALKKYGADEDIKSLASKYLDYNFIFVKRALISLLAESKDKNIIPVLNDLAKKSTDDNLVRYIERAVKKLES